jgi:hypothetical protein
MKNRSICYLLFFLTAFVLFLRVAIDYDLWLHLAIGQFIWVTHAIPKHDLFSFSLPNYPYAYHSWLMELILFAQYKAFGLWGVSLFYASLCALGATLLFDTFFENKYRRYLFATCIITIPIFSYIIHARTQTVSFFFLSLVYWIYTKVRANPAKNSRYLYSIPLITFCWANLHGGFIQGILIIGGLTGIVLLQQILIKRSITIALVATASTFLNPYGLTLHRQAFAMATDPTIRALNQDWAPLFNHQPGALALGIVLTAAMIIVLIKNHASYADKILLTIFYILTIISRRYALPFSVLLLPQVTSTIASIAQRFSKQYAIFHFYQIPAYGALCGLALIIVTKIPITISGMYQAYAHENVYASYNQSLPFPYGAVQFLKTHTVPARLLNDFNWGGYLIWNLPTRKFFVDGFMDAYIVHDVSFARTYWNLIHKQGDWQQTWDMYGFNAILAPINDHWQIVTWAQTQPDWVIAYEDSVSILLIKK